jgi:hypothetical protein
MAEKLAAVVHLSAYRSVVVAAQFRRGCLHDPPWLDQVPVEMDDAGDAHVVVWRLYDAS